MASSENSNVCKRLKSILIAPFRHKKLLFLITLLLLFYTSTGKYAKNNSFDYFIFSQRWLPSACVEYMEHNPRLNHCTLPQNFQTWTIHGLWPTQANHMGPFFCNKSMAFDINKLRPIESTLKILWPNIEEGKDISSLWQHEWDKHGTCAAQINSLNSEIKYFNVALNFFKMYNVETALKKSNILPNHDNTASVSDLFAAVKNAFGKVPQVHCIHEVKTNQPYLSEIRLCFNKNLELIECGSIHNNKFYSGFSSLNSITNCPLNRRIIIPYNINLIENTKPWIQRWYEMDYYDFLTEILRIIRFLLWASI